MSLEYVDTILAFTVVMILLSLLWSCPYKTGHIN